MELRPSSSIVKSFVSSKFLFFIILATSAGEVGPNTPRVEALVQDVLQVCLARNVPCGYPIVAPTREDAERETARRLAEGFKVLAVMTSAR